MPPKSKKVAPGDVACKAKSSTRSSKKKSKGSYINIKFGIGNATLNVYINTSSMFWYDEIAYACG